MRKIEDVVNDVLKNDAQKNALDLIGHLRVKEKSGNFLIKQHDAKDESGWDVSGLGFIIVNGADDFPGPWTMWLNAGNIGDHSEAEGHVKEFAWAHVSPCGDCGGKCSPGSSARIFGKDFENTCQSNLMFVNPDAQAVACIKSIVDIKENEANN